MQSNWTTISSNNKRVNARVIIDYVFSNRQPRFVDKPVIPTSSKPMVRDFYKKKNVYFFKYFAEDRSIRFSVCYYVCIRMRTVSLNPVSKMDKPF